MSALFPMGRIVATPGALELASAGRILGLLQRHVSGDWGNVPPEDAKENEISVERGFRVVSSYEVAGERLWAITEADRSSTCVLRPEEY